LKPFSPRRLQALHEEYSAEAARVLARRLHQAAVLLELRRDGLTGYLPDPLLLGPSLRQLQADVDELSGHRIDLRAHAPLRLCEMSAETGNPSPQLDLTVAACQTRAGNLDLGRSTYVGALLKSEGRAVRARCLTSIAAIHLVQEDLAAAQSFSMAAMVEDPGLWIVQSNSREIEKICKETGL
jgi:hypothetical protein